MRVYLRNKERISEGIKVRELEKLIAELLHSENKKLGEIEIVFLDDQELLQINRIFLKHNYFTDVITFDYNKKERILGDIYISVETVKKNAERFKQDFITELRRVIIHGVLHLAGYDDKTGFDREAMKIKEDFYLNRYRDIANV